MVLFSHAFIRKRVISLATSASVAATSFALAQDPAKTSHVRDGRQYAPDQQAHSDVLPLLWANAASMQKLMADTAMEPTGDIDRDFVEMAPRPGCGRRGADQTQVHPQRADSPAGSADRNDAAAGDHGNAKRRERAKIVRDAFAGAIPSSAPGTGSNCRLGQSW
jgi:hypothetical protein